MNLLKWDASVFLIYLFYYYTFFAWLGWQFIDRTLYSLSGLGLITSFFSFLVSIKMWKVMMSSINIGSCQSKNIFCERERKKKKAKRKRISCQTWTQIQNRWGVKYRAYSSDGRMLDQGCFELDFFYKIKRGRRITVFLIFEIKMLLSFQIEWEQLTKMLSQSKFTLYILNILFSCFIRFDFFLICYWIGHNEMLRQ